jgi:hypothetical protein
MKKYFLLLLCAFLFSCQDSESVENQEELDSINNIIYPVEGIDWVLTHGYIYIDNLDSQEKDVYEHFGANKYKSSTSIFDSSFVLMDSLHKDVTNWKFNNGTFSLNDNHIFDYEYNSFSNTYIPYGLNGGTSRPIQVITVTDNILVVRVAERYNSYNNTNYNYWSILTFIKAGTSCTNCFPNIQIGYIYKGVWNIVNNSPSTNLIGTKWVVNRYNNGLSGNVYPNDTLSFVTGTSYKINNSSSKSYVLSSVIGNNNKSLSFYSFSTLGGDYSGQFIETFIDDYTINNSTFTDMFNVNY